MNDIDEPRPMDIEGRPLAMKTMTERPKAFPVLVRDYQVLTSRYLAIAISADLTFFWHARRL